MPAASAPLLTALKASLQNASHGWQASSFVENTSSTPGVDPDTMLATVTVSKQVIVALFSPKIRIAIGDRAPLSITYIATLNETNVYQSAKLMIDGLSYTTTDTALHTIVMAMINARLTTMQANVIASLNNGPQVFN